MNSELPGFVQPKWTRKPKARPFEVLDAALDLFARNGFAATRMEDIAKAAGLSKAAIYLYFPSKEDVFKALIETRIVNLRDQIGDVATTLLDDPIGGLREVVRLWTASHADGRMIAIPRIVLAESARFPELTEYYHRVVISQMQGVLYKLLEAGVAQGVFRKIEPRVAARALVAPMMFEMLRRQAFVGETENLSLCDVSEAFFDLFLNGITAQDTTLVQGKAL
jgi:AcrR family transcriptional regulator